LRKSDNTYWRYIPNPAHGIVDPTTGQYPAVTDADFEEIEYGTYVLFGSTAFDAEALFTDNNEDNGLAHYFYNLPLNVHGDLDLRVQSGI